MNRVRILLIGCGRYARQAHLPAMRQISDKVRLDAVVDLQQNQTAIEAELRNHGFAPCPYIPVDNQLRERDTDPHAIEAALLRHGVTLIPGKTGVILSTYGVSHSNYIRWALEKHCHLLVDKPLSVRPNCSTNIHAAREIVKEFKEFTKLARKGKLLFMLATQRRYQPTYHEIARRITLYRKLYPVTFVQCLTNDGFWLDPANLANARAFDPERSGGGKLVHTGYHILDIIPWLLRHGNADIDNATVFTSTFRPHDAASLQQQRSTAPAMPEDRAEINIAVQVAFKNQRHVRCMAQLGMLHEGLSTKRLLDPTLKDWELAGSGRTKQEILTIYQGPIAAVWMVRIAKLNDAGKRPGGASHQNLWFGANRARTEAEPFEQSNLPYQECDTAPTREFLEALQQPTPSQVKVRSPVADHYIGIRLLSAAYEAAALGKPVSISFRAEDWSAPPDVHDL